MKDFELIGKISELKGLLLELIKYNPELKKDEIKDEDNTHYISLYNCIDEELKNRGKYIRNTFKDLFLFSDGYKEYKKRITYFYDVDNEITKIEEYFGGENLNGDIFLLSLKRTSSEIEKEINYFYYDIEKKILLKDDLKYTGIFGKWFGDIENAKIYIVFIILFMIIIVSTFLYYFSDDTNKSTIISGLFGFLGLGLGYLFGKK
ncbi:MAG: hypothetical protein V3575_05400 [Candidatus Absconditabacteria bacterium]